MKAIMMRIRKADLGPLTPLADGAFGRVFRVHERVLPDLNGPLAYKEFSRDHLDQGWRAETAVAFREALESSERAELDRYCVWPCAVVEDEQETICGLLMPLIPTDFFCTMIDPDSGQVTSRPREASWLIASREQRIAAQVEVPDIHLFERLVFVAQLTYVVAWLHGHGWVLGDISFRNAVFALGPPRLMLVDCDGAAPIRDLDRKQYSTFSWDPPEGSSGYSSARQDLQDAATDVYKLGLAIVRWLTPGRGASTSRAVSRLADELDPEGIALVTRALSETRATRPTARDLYDYFYRIVPHTDGLALPRLGPPRPVVPPLPGLRSDAPSAEDLLGTSTDADTLARLIAAAQTVPPLAIALIGEWGAGKSSVMLQIQQRLDELARMSREDPKRSAFVANVRQVRFNAWDYSDDQVWAGLAENLFQSLAADPGTSQDSGGSAEAEAERAVLGRDLAVRQAEERRLSDALKAADASTLPRGYLAGLSSPVYALRVIAIAAREFSHDVKSSMPVLLGWAALAAAALGAWYLWGSVTGVTSAAVVAVITPVVVIGRRLLRMHGQGTDLIGAQRRRLDARQRIVRQEIADLRERLALSDAQARLSAFLANRATPDAYRQYRSLLGQVRADLARLSADLAQARRDWLANGAVGEPPLERIVLYIDDLDRCPPHRVVEVLEAIHLMLALDLFVVVVAVDARWLVRSLEYHYHELFSHSGESANTDGSMANPADYLDKIFQIPYALTPPSPAALGSFLRSLLPTPAPAASTTVGSSGTEEREPRTSALQQGLSSPRKEAQTQSAAPLSAVGSTPGLTDPHPVGLQLGRHEVEFMERLGPLLPTPRAAKRLANLYRLVRIGIQDNQLAEFVGSRVSGGPYQAVQILLAILVGSPIVAPRIFEDLMEASPDSDFLAVLETEVAQDSTQQPQRSRITAELIAIASRTQMQTAVKEYQRWCLQLARHSFHTRTLAIRSASLNDEHSGGVQPPPAQTHRQTDRDTSELPTARSGIKRDNPEYDSDYVSLPTFAVSAEPACKHESADQITTAQPFYLVCDVSYSMRDFLTIPNGDLGALCQVIRTELSRNNISPQICVMTCSNTAQVLVPMESIDNCSVLQPPMEGQANYSAMLRLLGRTIKQDAANLREHGYRVHRPCAFFLTSGEPSGDDWRTTLAEIMAQIHNFDLDPILVPFGVGNASENLLRELVYPTQPGNWFHSKSASLEETLTQIPGMIEMLLAPLGE
jgi:uncharacterized protein YegL